MGEDQHIRQLFKKYIEGQCTRKEVEQLLSYFGNCGDDSEMMELISGEMHRDDKIEDAGILNSITQTAGQKIFARTKHRSLHLSTFAKVSIAAALLIGLAIFLILSSRVSRNVKKFSDGDISVLAGTDKAVLSLSDGRRIPLGKNAALTLAEENGTKITQEKDGKIIYQGSSGQVEKNLTNELEVPKGGQFSVTLSDGTKVWLNAGSTLKYPVNFAVRGNRTVQLTGEAYFEVAKDSSRPFVVNTQRQRIEVLGTHFNINSYSEEPKSITTLAEGSVRVRPLSGAMSSFVLKPGESAITDTKSTQVGKADMQTAMAWRKGMIYFRDAPLTEIMRQVSRWYNIEIDYNAKVPDRSFTGGIYRNADLSELLKILMLNDIHFTLTENQNNRKLIVKP